MSTLLSAAYYLRIVRRAFFAPTVGGGRPGTGEHPEVEKLLERAEEAAEAETGQAGAGRVREVSYFALIPAVVTAAITAALGIYPAFLLKLVGQVFR